MDYKLSKRMIEALKNMNIYGDYELIELPQWNWWQAINRSELGISNIRTDTMKGLIYRNLVQEKYDEATHKFTAILTEMGKTLTQQL